MRLCDKHIPAEMSIGTFRPTQFRYQQLGIFLDSFGKIFYSMTFW